MESLPDRTCRVLDQRDRSVATVATVVRWLRADGCAVTEWVLLRALRLDPRFRVLDPLRGPLAGIRPEEPFGRPAHDLTLVRIDTPARPTRGNRSEPYAPDHLVRRSLAHLAEREEPVSPMDQVRWLCMLREAGLETA